MNKMMMNSNIYSLSSLVIGSEIEFVKNAYLTILQRDADLEGMQHYLKLLRKGKTRHQIISQFVDSEEAKKFQFQLIDLKRELAEYNSLNFAFKRLLGKVFVRNTPATTAEPVITAMPTAIATTHVLEEKQSTNLTIEKEKPTVKKVNFDDLRSTLVVDDFLKGILENKESNVFWAGEKPPLAWMNASSRIYSPEFDYRMPSDFHQKFNLVYLKEKNLGTVKAWPLVVDEAMRLLAPGGRLVIKFSHTGLLTAHELKNFLCQWGDFEVNFEHTFKDSYCLFGVTNMSNKPRECNLSGVSFGVVTDGKRPEPLDEFIKSAYEVTKANGQEVEVIVCGPISIKKDLEEKYANIKFVLQPDEFENLGWITKKKNLIVNAAKYENLVIAHDRYVISKDFLLNLEEFGSDFSVLACKQLQNDGRRLPDWVTLGGEWELTSPAVLAYGDWNRYLYLNGGIIIGKRAILKKVPWNELLFWGQAEDVELTRRLRANGIVPRLARHVAVTSVTLRAGFMNGFEVMPVISDLHMIPTGGLGNCEKTVPFLKWNRIIHLNSASEKNIAYEGVYVDSSWVFSNNNITLPGKTFGEIAFKLRAPRNASTNEVRLIMTAKFVENLPLILINDIQIIVEKFSENQLIVALPSDVFLSTEVIKISMFCDKDFILENFELKFLQKIKAVANGNKLLFNSDSPGITMLGLGWSQPENWGVWLEGEQADLYINSAVIDKDILISGQGRALARTPGGSVVIGVMINDIPCANFSLPGGFEDNPFHFIVPSKLARSEMKITFVPNDPCSPLEAGLNQDGRRLSLGLVSLLVNKAS